MVPPGSGVAGHVGGAFMVPGSGVAGHVGGAFMDPGSGVVEHVGGAFMGPGFGVAGHVCGAFMGPGSGVAGHVGGAGRGGPLGLYILQPLTSHPSCLPPCPHPNQHPCPLYPLACWLVLPDPQALGCPMSVTPAPTPAPIPPSLLPARWAATSLTPSRWQVGRCAQSCGCRCTRMWPTCRW